MGRPSLSRWRPLLLYALRRLAFVPLGLFLVLTVSFAVANVVPNDPVRTLLGDLATPEQVAEVRAELGLDQPLHLRFLKYVGGLARADFGTSYYSHKPISQEIWVRLPSTLELVTLAIAVALVYGIAIGSLGAYFNGRAVDRISGALVSLHQAVPDFVTALVGSFVFFFLLKVLPAPVGQLDIDVQPAAAVTGAALLDGLRAGDLDVMANAAWHLILPVAALATFAAVPFAKTSRATMGEALVAPYSEFARACGFPERRVFSYALRASRGPILTYTALVAAGLVGGDAIIETIFSWHGIGQWAVESILKRDLPAVQGFVLVTGTVTLIAYFAVDVALIFLDPRVARRAT